jgi:hypothetical protein
MFATQLQNAPVAGAETLTQLDHLSHALCIGFAAGVIGR